MSYKTDNGIEHIAVSVKGVTQFNRQDNLKFLAEQELSKEEKKLSLEKFTDGKNKTFLVIMNGLEIGTLPEDSLERILYPAVNYELTNIHIGTMPVEKGRIIYFAKLFITLTPVEESQSAPPKKTCYSCGSENQTYYDICSACYDDLQYTACQYKTALSNIEKINRQLTISKKDNENLKRKLDSIENINKNIKQELDSQNKSPKILAIVVLLVASIVIIFSIGNNSILRHKNNSLTIENEELTNKIENSAVFLEVNEYTKTVYRGEQLDITLTGGVNEEFLFTVLDSNSKGIAENKTIAATDQTNNEGVLYESIDIPKSVKPGEYYLKVDFDSHTIKLPFSVE